MDFDGGIAFYVCFFLPRSGEFGVVVLFLGPRFITLVE